MSIAALASGAIGSAHALGLGNLRVHSGLGQQLRAQLEVAGAGSANLDQTCFKAKVETADGTFLVPANVVLSSSGASPVLSLSTRQNLLEPAVKVIVDAGCETQLHREYVILLDPPQLMPAAEDRAAADVAPAGRNAEPRKQRVRTAAVAQETAAESRPGPATSRQPKSGKAAKPVRDALKLSDDVVMLPQGLRLSDSLSIESGRQLTMNREELRAAQAQLAAILRDENPDQSAGDRLRADQQKIQVLQQEAGQLKRQSQIDKAALDELRESSFSRNWMIGLSALILAGLAVIAMLLTYISRMHRKFASSWWQPVEAKPEPAPKKSIEEIVDSVQASYGPPTTVAPYPGFPVEQPDSTLRAYQATPLGAHAERAPDKLDSASDISRVYQSPTLEDSNSSTFNFFSTRGQSVKVEEISDVTQEAEFWMSVNDPQRAIEILEPQAAIEHPDSPVPWLYLLDLYRITGNQQKYEGLRDRFAVFFNANIPEFDVDPATIGSRQLEDFGHLIQRICDLWNTNDIVPFLQSLLVDDRDGKRIGFELPVYRDILLLIAIANEMERAKALGGGNGVHHFGARAALNGSDELEDPHSNMINFEVIDFKKNK